MGELVDAKGRVRFFCEVCGGVSHGMHHCVACEPPDTVREKQGQKWWSKEWPRDRRPPLSRCHIAGVVEAPPRVSRPRKKRSDAERVPETGEMPFLHAMMNAIREMLGMDPLYGQNKTSDQRVRDSRPHPFFDEREQSWKR